MTSLLIVGLDNPQSGDPRHALYPRPRGCSGARLFEIMRDAADGAFTELSYHSIPKTNLFPVGRAVRGMESTAGDLLRAQQKSLKTDAWIVLLGSSVRDAVLSVAAPERPMRWHDDGRAHYTWIPHPSGRSHDYNDKKFRRKVGEFLLTSYYASDKRRTG